MTIDIKIRAVAININQTYEPHLTDAQLYDFTRGVWRLDRDRAEGAKYALAVFQGKIVEMYETNKWHRAGHTEYVTGRTFSDRELATRFEFSGRVAADDVREQYVGKLLSEQHTQNPIKYFKC